MGERYRAKALELFTRAEVESSPVLKVEFEELAAAYLRLAEQAERKPARHNGTPSLPHL
jgi:hypothetical protein